MTSTANLDEILTFITGWLSQLLGQPVAPDANFGALGMDSLDAVNLADALADRLGRDEVPVATILEHPTPRSLADWLAHETSLSEQ